MGDNVIVTVVDDVMTIRLNRPEARNALGLPEYQAILDALRRARAEHVAAVVLTGGNDFFSAGGDVATMQEPGSELQAPAERLEIAHRIIVECTALDVPVIAAVERYAIGVSWGIALAADLLVAGEGAFFQAPFAQRGLVADGAAAWNLPRRVGHQRAMRYLLLAERMPATVAHELGLVSHLVPDGQATTVAERLAAELSQGPRESNALTKRLAIGSAIHGLHAFLDAELMAYVLAYRGSDAIEGRVAFREKRPAQFRLRE